MHLPARLSALAVAAVLLAACAADPFVDRRREAGTLTHVGQSTPDRVVICYNANTTTPQTLLDMAREECAKTGREARFIGQQYWQCRLFQPTRAIFRCEGGENATAP